MTEVINSARVALRSHCRSAWIASAHGSSGNEYQRKLVLALVNLVVLVVFFAGTAYSQTDRGSIRGTVLDPTGAVIANATVTVTNVATETSSSMPSTSAGTYNFTALPSGVYRVEAQLTGFKSLVRENVAVSAANITGLDLIMEVGNTAEIINVTAEAPLLQTESSSQEASVDARAYVDLPLSSAGGRRAGGFMVLVPGYSGAPTGFTDSINGSQASTREIQLEGASMVTQEITGDSRNITFPPDAVQEMSVTTSGYSAEYGNTGGGAQRFALKSGTNQFHGSGYGFVQNEILDAQGYFNTVKPRHRENEFGGTIGGPIFRNKTFFFFAFNGYTLGGANSTQILSVPTAAFRSGDFSAWPQAIYDPATTRPNPSNPSQLIRDPFPNKIIPANRIDPTAKKIMDLYPLPNMPGNFNNYAAQVPASKNNRWTYTGKGDHHFNDSHSVSGSYVQTNNPQELGGNGLPLPIGSQNSTPFGFKFFRSTYDWTVRPNLLNQFRVGYNWQLQAVYPPTRDGDWPQQLGLKGMELGSGMFPVISLGSITSTGVARPLVTDRTSRTYTFSDALSWTTGGHNLKFGVELRRLDTSYTIQENSINLGFSRNQTASPTSLGNTGLEFASFLLGQVNSAVLPLRGEVLPYIRTYQSSMYVQDDFKVTPRLTLNLGLRYDIFTPLTDRDKNYSIINTEMPNPFAGNLPGVYLFAGHDGLDKRIPPADKNQNNFGPRVGFAYKLTDNTVVRSGYGISYFQTGAYGGGNNIGFTDGYWIDNTAISPNQVDAAFTLANGYPANQLIVPPLISPSLGVGSGITVRYWDPNAAKAAYSQNWNLNVQRQLGANLSVDIGYVGSKGTHLPTRTDINQLDPKYLQDPAIRALLNSNINAPAVVAAGFKPPYPGFNLRLGQALRPFPQFPNMFPGGRSSDNSGNSTYHSLQATVQKRFSHGLYASGAYTWSQWLSDAPNNFVNNASINRNIYDRSMSKTFPSAHRPHTLAVSFNYELPVGPGKPFLGGGGLLGKIVGGWQLNGILRYQHGNRLGVSAPQTNPIYDGTVGIVGAESALAIPQTADLVAGVPMKLYNGGKFNAKDPNARYLNPAAFTLPAGIFGNTREFIPGLFGWRFFNEDLGLIKKTQITERITWDLRLEAFNAFNRTRFGNPSTNIANPQTFGRITSASGQRSGQIAMKITF